MPDRVTPPEQIEAMAAAAFHRRRALLTMLDDRRLNDIERRFLERIGAKLYGEPARAGGR